MRMKLIAVIIAGALATAGIIYAANDDVHEAVNRIVLSGTTVEDETGTETGEVVVNEEPEVKPVIESEPLTATQTTEETTEEDPEPPPPEELDPEPPPEEDPDTQKETIKKILEEQEKDPEPRADP